MAGDGLEDATIGMAEEMLARDDRGSFLWKSVMADLEADGLTAEDIAALFGPAAPGDLEDVGDGSRPSEPPDVT